MGTFITSLTSSQTDEDSPINQTLMDAVRVASDDLDSEIASFWNGSTFSSNTVDQTSVAASAIGQGELKTTTESQTTTAGAAANLFFNNGIGYQFNLRARISAGSGNHTFRQGTDANSSGTQRVCVRHQGVTGGATAEYLCRYVTASPPHYLLGDQDWGKWVYAIVRGSDVIQAWSADDPPSYLSLASRLVGADGKPDPRLCALAKRRPGLHASRPHPFPELYQQAKADTDEGRALAAFLQGSRVVLLDLRGLEEDDPDPWSPERAEAERAADALDLATLPSEREQLERYLEDARSLADQADQERAEAAQKVAEFAETPEKLAEAKTKRMAEILGRLRADIKANRRAHEATKGRVAALREELEQLSEAEELTLEQEWRRLELQGMLPRLERHAKGYARSAERIETRILPEMEELVRLGQANLAQRAGAIWTHQRRILRARAGILTKRQRLEFEREEAGGSFLDLLHANRHPLVDAALGGIDLEDRNHPDHKHRPRTPGLFIRGQDGSPPAVTILSPR